MGCMTKHRVARRRLDRHGVKLLRLATGACVARWHDPLSGRQAQANLNNLGLSSVAQRQQWAAAKAHTLAATRAAIASGSVVAERASLLDAVKGWLARYTHEGTAQSYKMLADRFAAWAVHRGVRDVQGLTPPMLAAYRDDYARSIARAPVHGARRGAKAEGSRRRAPSSVNLGLTVAKMFLSWARRRGWTPNLSDDTIAESLVGVKVPKQAIRFLRPAELRKLLEAARRHDAATPDNPRHTAAPVAPFVLAVLLSGGRFDEVASLRWDEVDLQAGEIRLPAARVKTRAARTIRLDVAPTLLDLLTRLKLRAQGVLVFEMPRGRAEDARRRLVHDFGAPLFTWHDLRRTCGTILTNAPSIYGAASAFLSAKRLGHSVVLAEKSYLGVLTDMPATAKTIEAAAGIETECAAIVAAAGGVVAAPLGATAAG